MCLCLGCDGVVRIGVVRIGVVGRGLDQGLGGGCWVGW